MTSPLSSPSLPLPLAIWRRYPDGTAGDRRSVLFLSNPSHDRCPFAQMLRRVAQSDGQGGQGRVGLIVQPVGHPFTQGASWRQYMAFVSFLRHRAHITNSRISGIRTMTRPEWGWAHKSWEGSHA